ncbi:MAG: TadE/TadG family type IV pilus assembly protein [Acetobacteraceae bacterium]
MRRTRRIGADRRGIAALEFALLAPILIVIAMSLTDVTNAVIAWWQLSSAADAIARIATTYAATNNNSNSITTAQAATAGTAVFAVMPALASAPTSRYGVTLSSVVMTATTNNCTSNCAYVANTAWSATLQGAAPTRPCGNLSSVPDGHAASSGTLPADTFTAAPMLVVDVTYDFTPLFTNLFGSGLRFMESAYMAARTGGDADWVRLTGPNSTSAKCPGYPG